MTQRADQITKFLRINGWGDALRKPVAGDASNRRYDRLTGDLGRTAILMDAPPDTGEDVRSFVRIAEHLRATGLSAPAIYNADHDAGLLLIEDFGDALFADLMAGDQGKEIPLYQSALDVLIHLRDVPVLDVPVCDPNYLVGMIDPLFEWYAPDSDAMDSFADLFRPFADQTTGGKSVLVLRDYHAQNLLLLPDRTGIKAVGLLDFQDAMSGHPAYDVVSILQDARRDVSVEVEQELLNYLQKRTGDDPHEFALAYAILGLQRNLRILGIFSRLCLRDGKVQYVDFIPRVWRYVQRNLAQPDLEPLARFLGHTLPEPTPTFLQSLRVKCPKPNSPS